MLRKITLTLLLIGFIGILVWGGINRTQAKTAELGGDSANNQNTTHLQDTVDDHQPHNEEDCAEEADRGVNDHGAARTQGQSNGNGFEGAAAKENAAASASETGHSSGASGSRGQGRGNGQGGGSDPLTASEIEALNLALDDEYHALAVYQSVIATFGEVEPFVEIAASEQRHIEALVNQFDRHDLPVPENPWVGTIPAFDSLQQACQAGVAAEVANADLYEQLFSMTDDPGLTRVFTNLSNASLNSHLPQFEACQ
jgi:hypothetical protein